MKTLTILLMTLCWVFALAGTSPEQPTLSGQILKYETTSGGMLVDSGVDWNRYTKFQLDKATVEFREDWVRDQVRLNRYVITEFIGTVGSSLTLNLSPAG